MINYSEFLAATIDMKTFLTEARLKIVFTQFDTDLSGKITVDNIIYAMQKLGKQVKREQVHEIIAKHDRTGDGMLNFDEFKAIFDEADNEPASTQGKNSQLKSHESDK